MIKKLGIGLLLVGLNAQLHAEVIVLKDGQLQTQACAYGRGATAIGSAKAQAAVELAAFLRSNKQLALSSGQEHLTLNDETQQLYASQRELLLEGLKQESIQIDTSSPKLQGNDTCITATLALNHHVGSGSLGWSDDVQDVSVTVIGEGWQTTEKNARQNAEQDALQRALSQVVGVWISQQHSQSSQTYLQIQGEQEQTVMQDLIGQQLSMHTEGLIKEWRTLASKPLNDKGLQVTLQVLVEKQPLIQQASQLLKQIGSPTVQVNAPEPLKSVISVWLGDQGIEINDNAALIVTAHSKLRATGQNRRLQLSVMVHDVNNNVYSKWKNAPSLLALPNDDSVLTDLIDVHLADEDQHQALKDSLQKGFTQVVARGGVQRKLLIPDSLIKNKAQLAQVLDALAGVSHVSLEHKKAHTVALVRFKGTNGELAHAVNMALSAIAIKPLPTIEIKNNYTLSYL